MSSVKASLRLVRAFWVLLREGVLTTVPPVSPSRRVHLFYRFACLFAKRRQNNTERAQRLAKMIQRLGPSYVKLGQFLATRPDIIGTTLASDFARLQDKMDVFPTPDAVDAIESSLGRSINDLFTRFDEPIAAASIAQVHPALIDNKKVAVKVIRPNVRRQFANDLESFLLLARLQERFLKDGKRLKPVEVTQDWGHATRVEMDLRLEAAALSEFAENTKNDPDFRVPFVDWERTGRDVLTMEWIDGIKMNDVEGLKAAGHDLPHLAITLIQSFLRHALRDGFFHADMHQGNLFVDERGTIVAIDLGIAGRLGKKERHFLAEILFGFIARDYYRVAKVHFDAGYVPAKHNISAFAQAIRAIGEPIHGQSAQTISMAKLLTLLFEVTQVFDMETRPELVLLQKTMVVVEGVARTLDPNFNMWKAGEPVVGAWIADNIGPCAVIKDLSESARSLFDLARALPDFVARTERLSVELDRLAQQGFKREMPARSRSVAYALWVIALLLTFITYSLFEF